MIELANALIKRNEVILMLPTNHRFTPRHYELIDVKINFIPFHVIFFKSFRENFKMIWKILSVLWKHRPDVLHIQANGHRLFYWVLFFKPLKTKVINTIHDPIKHTGDLASLAIDDSKVIAITKLFTSHYIVHGLSLLPELSKSYSIPISKIHVIPHGHFEIYKKFQIGEFVENPFQVLFFGRIWAYKGLPYFIEAGNILSQKMPQVKFVIAGKGEDMDQYLDLIKAKNNFEVINERVSLEQAGQFFQESAIVVLPYIDATQSGVIPVAYAYSKPVVATHVGSIPEVVIDGQTGFLVNPKSGEELAEKIFLLLKDSTLRRTMGQQAYTFSKKNLSWDLIAKKTEDVYKLN